ncbi:carbohydrate kinase family protein [Roseibium album]|uniref:carbohydrate kinase family protein n=1 Tax=Roseibium album TaxID=311410 RepID=UPI002490B3E7|nr:sugar kinase [Roseibium album]
MVYTFPEKEEGMSQTRTIASVGEVLVEFVSHRRNCSLELISDYSGPYPSGAPAIFLDQAARMGARTEMIGGVGRDGFGRSVVKRLNADGVGTRGIQFSENRSTGVAFVSYYDSGDRDFIFHLSGTAADQFETPFSLLDPAQTILHVSASSLGAETMRSKILAAVRQVSAAGGWITCDPNARPELMSDLSAVDAIHEVMDCSYCLLPSTSDLRFLFPDLSEEIAVNRLLDARAEIVVVKRGASGATVVGQGERFDFPGHDVNEIDPTGAGDCFCGTFVSLISQGVPLFEAGQKANAAGAIAVTRRGPMEGNSSPGEIKRFLESAKPKEFTA